MTRPILTLFLLLLALPIPRGIAAAENGLRLTIALPVDGDLRAIGLFIAEERGYFAAAGIDLAILPYAEGETPLGLLAAGKADLAIATLPQALAERARGIDIVHVAQIFQKPTLRLVCRPGLADPRKLAGRRVGLWFDGWQVGFFAWIGAEGILPGGPGGIATQWQDRSARDFLADRLDCYTTTTYLAPLQGLEKDNENAPPMAIDYAEKGLGIVEDGLYMRAADLGQPGRVEAAARFLLALERGYRALAGERAIGLKTLRALDPERGARPKAGLIAALDAILAALDLDHRPFGALDAAAYDDTILQLMTMAPEPILKAAPQGAIRTEIRDRARELAAP